MGKKLITALAHIAGVVYVMTEGIAHGFDPAVQRKVTPCPLKITPLHPFLAAFLAVAFLSIKTRLYLLASSSHKGGGQGITWPIACMPGAERVVCVRNRDPSRTTTPPGGLSL